METRANYVLIGLFTVGGILAALGFFAWLANVQIDRRYAYYDVLFNSVSGLSRGAEVRFNGLPVGQVITLDLYAADPTQVRAGIEIAAETPVNQETTAQLQAQGLTGVAYVSLSSGRPDAAALAVPPGHDVPVIPSRRSIVEQLTEDAPDLVTQIMELMGGVRDVLSDANLARVTSILANLDAASGELDTALADFGAVSASVAEATRSIDGFAARLAPLGAGLESALATAERTLEVARGTFAEAETTLAAATGAIEQAGTTLQGADALIRDDLPGAIDELQTTVASLRGAIDAIGPAAARTVADFGTTARLANARLADIEATLTALDGTLEGATATLAAVQSASTSVETLVEGEATDLVAEARATLAAAETSLAAIEWAATEDLPTIAADVRSAVENASGVIASVGEDVSRFTTDLAPLSATAEATLQAAATTFRDAGATLAGLDAAIGAAERTLAAAEATFAGASRIIDEQAAPTAADIRAASARLADAADRVAEDLPTVTADLRAAIARATEVVARVDAIVAQSAPPVQEFTQTGLPQFTRFTQEARALVAQLESLTARIDRDPARFFLGGQAPEFRR